MSNHNYSQYSNKNVNKQNVQREVKPHVVKTETEEAAPKVNLVAETVKTVALPALVAGVVARCAKLNVREKPIVSSDIVCVLNSRSEIKIDMAKSTTNWFYIICANGAEGYCMREYIDARV